jgi:hypothetical protein
MKLLLNIYTREIGFAFATVYIRSGSLYLRILPGIYRGQSPHPLIKLNIEMECERKMFGRQHRQSKYRSYSTSGPEVYLSGYCQVYIEDSPSHPLIKLNI